MDKKVQESTEYQSFEGVRSEIPKAPVLPTFDAPEEDVVWKKGVEISEKDYHQKITVSFRNSEDFEEFQTLIGQAIPHKVNEIWHPKVAKDKPTLSSFFGETETPQVVPVKVKPKRVKSKVQLEVDIEERKDPNHWTYHWLGMPEFVQEDNPPARKFTAYFRTEDDFKEFQSLIGQEMTNKTKSIWHPKLDRTANSRLRWIEE